MRVKLSGPIDVVEALEAALRSTADASLETPLTRRENSQLRFGMKEVAEIVVYVKDFAELVALCWAGIQALWSELAKPQPKSGVLSPLRRFLSRLFRRSASDGGTLAASNVGKLSIPLEITTLSARIIITVPLECTRDQLEEQLALLDKGQAS